MRTATEGLAVTQKSVFVFFEIGINMPRTLRFSKLRSTAFLKTFLPTTTVTGSFRRPTGLFLIIRSTLNREFFSVFLAPAAQNVSPPRGATALQKTVGTAALPLFGLISSFWH